jgi:hypothetical protein
LKDLYVVDSPLDLAHDLKNLKGLSIIAGKIQGFPSAVLNLHALENLNLSKIRSRLFLKTWVCVI